MRVLAMSGSLRRGSHNTALLRAAAQAAPPGVALEIYDGLDRVPPFNEDLEGEPPLAVADLSDAVLAADALLFATPEYNVSIPGQLKNVVDWLSRPTNAAPLREKPAAVVGASTGHFGAVWAQAELRKVLGAAGARVITSELAVRVADEAFDQQGRLGRAEDEQRLNVVLAELIAAAAAPGQCAA